MSDNLTSTLTISFIDEENSSRQKERDKKQSENVHYYVVLEQSSRQLMSDKAESEGLVVDNDPYIYIHCFPKGATLNASNGSLDEGTARVKTIIEVVNFNATDGVRLNYPSASNVVITELGSAMKVIEDKEGNVTKVESISPSFEYNSVVNSIIAKDGFADVKIYGACKVEYSVDYNEYKYTPDPISLGAFNVKEGQTESLFGGIIYAFITINKRTFGTTLEVKLDPPPKPVEYARVYSKIVLDADGPHEAPQDWPENTSIESYQFNSRLKTDFPNRNLELKKELDPDNSFTDERAHLVITIDTFGNLHYEYYSHYFLDPFPRDLIKYIDALEAQVYGTWGVQYYIRFAEPQGGKVAKSVESFYFDMYNLTWRDVFNWVDKTGVFDRLKNNSYPNLKDESVKDEE